MKLLINFYASISDITINNLIKFITQISADQIRKNNPLREIVIEISSSGGSADHGLLAYNFLRQLGLKITVIAMGNVDSAAVILFCSGDKRISVPSCRFVIHEATSIIKGQFNLSKLNELKNVTEIINTNYCEVISKVCNKKIGVVKNKIKEGLVMSPQQAKEFGLVTEISEKPYITDTKDMPIIGITNPQIIQQPKQI